MGDFIFIRKDSIMRKNILIAAVIIVSLVLTSCTNNDKSYTMSSKNTGETVELTYNGKYKLSPEDSDANFAFYLHDGDTDIVHIGIASPDITLDDAKEKAEDSRDTLEILESTNTAIAYHSKNEDYYQKYQKVSDRTIIVFTGYDFEKAHEATKDFTFEVTGTSTENPKTQTKAYEIYKNLVNTIIIPEGYQQYTQSWDETAWIDDSSNTIHLLYSEGIKVSYYEKKYPEGKKINEGYLFKSPETNLYWFVLPAVNDSITIISDTEEDLLKVIENL